MIPKKGLSHPRSWAPPREAAIVRACASRGRDRHAESRASQASFRPAAKWWQREASRTLAGAITSAFSPVSSSRDLPPHGRFIGLHRLGEKTYGVFPSIDADGQTDQVAGDYAEDLAATMLATTMGLEFDPDAAWDQKRQLFTMSELIVRNDECDPIGGRR